MSFDAHPLVIGGSLVVGFLLLCVWLFSLEAAQWNTFKEEHHCKQVSHVDSTFFNTLGLSSNGGVSVGVGSTDSKTGWLCDDGITYYR